MENVELGTLSREEMNSRIVRSVKQNFRKFQNVLDEEMEIIVHEDFELLASQVINDQISKNYSQYAIAFNVMNSNGRVIIKLLKERKKDNGQRRI